MYLYHLFRPTNKGSSCRCRLRLAEGPSPPWPPSWLQTWALRAKMEPRWPLCDHSLRRGVEQGNARIVKWCKSKNKYATVTLSFPQKG